MSDDYNLRHRVKCATPFAIGQDVHLRAEGKKGTVVATAGREIVVSSGGSLLRRNQVFASPCVQELPREEEVQNTSLQRTPLPVPGQLPRSSMRQVRSPCCQAEESQQPASRTNLDPPPNVTPSDAMKDVLSIGPGLAVD
ncbi:hypothetical protein EB796_023932 [Bugula neritina]|uniref:Uncharacterized protein n=1 Tax=Bugula neritina TaxID=10212 RepID=A0A7J7IWB9_BUGNE|nr:hypothetical protein EB796_023932 [Bugula neritina]